jgi:hypothetical protein
MEDHTQGDWVVIPDNIGTGAVTSVTETLGPIGLGDSFGLGIEAMGGLQCVVIRAKMRINDDCVVVLFLSR